MQVDFKELKQIVDEIILTEAKCLQLIQSLLTKENETLHSLVLDKVISILAKWPNTPPIEILKELEDFQNNKKLNPEGRQ